MGAVGLDLFIRFFDVGFGDLKTPKRCKIAPNHFQTFCIYGKERLRYLDNVCVCVLGSCESVSCAIALAAPSLV